MRHHYILSADLLFYYIIIFVSLQTGIMVHLVLIFAVVIIQYVYGRPSLPPLPMKGEHLCIKIYFFTGIYVYMSVICVCVEEFSFGVLCPLQMAATWCLQRWRYSEWRVKQSSSPSQYSLECLKYATSLPQQPSTSSPRTMGQTV